MAQTGAHSEPVTDEPKKRRKQSFPQEIGDVYAGDGFRWLKHKPQRSDRYITEDRVTKVNELPDGGSIWRVNGDTGTYRVIIDDVGVDWTCSCPAGLKGHQDCVHAFAVLTVLGLEPPEPPDIIHLDTPIVDVGVFNDPANHDATEGELLEAFPDTRRLSPHLVPATDP